MNTVYHFTTKKTFEPVFFFQIFLHFRDHFYHEHFLIILNCSQIFLLIYFGFLSRAKIADTVALRFHSIFFLHFIFIPNNNTIGHLQTENYSLNSCKGHTDIISYFLVFFTVFNIYFFLSSIIILS